MRPFHAFAAGLLLAGAVSSPAALAGLDARLARFPDVSDRQLVFVYAGDVWLAPREGGAAVRLSTPAGEELFPRFSPDGLSVAFTGNYDGNSDVYVMSVQGGLPRRLTFHPNADRVVDWHPDGEHVIFASSREAGHGRLQLFSVAISGGLPERLPVPWGEQASISGDGRRLAYVPLARDFRTWKRYRGGRAPDIWLFDLDRGSSQKLTDEASNDSLPMWHGSLLYFLSDRGPHRRLNLWVHDLRSGSFDQVTFFETQDVHFPAIGPRDIVFEQAGGLWLFDLETRKLRRTELEVVTDGASLRPRVEKVAKLIESVDISPKGKRLLFGARGEVFSVPVEHGFVRNLSGSPASAERYPAWSPDGSRVAFFSDASGEYELSLRSADGSGEIERVSRFGPGFRYSLHWSPDSRKLAFVDQAMRIHVHDLDARSTRQVDQGLDMFHGSLARFRPSWSPDSRWLAWSRSVENDQGVVFLHDSRSGETLRASSGFHDDRSPVFGPEGKYLYYLTGRSFDPIYSDLDGSWIYANSTRIAVLPLRGDLPSPLAPRNDDDADADADEDEDADTDEDEDEGAGEGKGLRRTRNEPGGPDGARRKASDAKAKGDKKKDGKGQEKPAPVVIDLEGLERRLVLLPPEAGNYGDLAALDGKLIYLRRPRTGGEGKAELALFDFEEREEKIIVSGLDGYRLASGGDKLLVIEDGKYHVIDPKPEQALGDAVALEGLEATIDPRAEWRQIFADAWRLERDYFYDPGMHGVDWEEMRRRYGALIEDCVSRWDVNFVIGELIGELNASHTYRGGGDTEQAPRRPVGLLGVNWRLDRGAWRIDEILRGADWDAEGRSPLAEPGVGIAEGDWVLAVNGRPLDPAMSPHAAFSGLAEATVELTVNSRPSRGGARKVLVETLGSERRLRQLAWVEANRKRVEEATGGRAGYVYVPNTGRFGQTELVRQFRGQVDRDALVIDERFNGGGQIPDRFVELLDRPLRNYWAVRDGRDWQWPPVAHQGPKVMLINEAAGSGGDAFPFYFRQSGLGPLIGKRTWGGLIGISGVPGLIDGGGVTVPTFSIYSTDGEWIIENHGVDPDIEVEADPALMQDGGDPQLEAGITEILRLLAERPQRRPARPAMPDRSGS